MKAMHVLIGLAVMALAAGDGVVAQEWSDPIELTDARDEFLENEFETVIDSLGNIHLIYWVQRYQQQQTTHRLLYSKFNPRGEPLRDRILPMGDDVESYYGRICLDDNDNAHICCLGRDENDDYQYWYTCIDENDDYITEPVVVEGLRYCSDWLGNQFRCFRRTDGTFIFTTLAPYYFHEEDSSWTNWVTYARFNDEGQLIDEPHYLFTVENPEYEEYYNLKSALDEEDNLHLVWRLTNTNQEDYVLYACISPDDEIITEPILVTPQFNDRHYSCNGLSAYNLQTIFLLMTDSRAQDEPYITYLHKMNYKAETEWYVNVVVNRNGASIYHNKWNDILLFTGRIKPDSLDRTYYYYSSVDTTGEIIDVIELIRLRPSPSSYPLQVQRSVDTLSVFNFRYYRYPECSIEMVQKIVQPRSVKDKGHLYIPECGFINAVYPNPFNNCFCLRLLIPGPNEVGMSLFDLSGRLILAKHQNFTTPGLHTISFSKQDQLGSLAAGNYVLRLSAAEMADRYITLTKVK